MTIVWHINCVYQQWHRERERERLLFNVVQLIIHINDVWNILEPMNSCPICLHIHRFKQNIHGSCTTWPALQFPSIIWQAHIKSSHNHPSTFWNAQWLASLPILHKRRYFCWPHAGISDSAVAIPPPETLHLTFFHDTGSWRSSKTRAAIERDKNIIIILHRFCWKYT